MQHKHIQHRHTMGWVEEWGDGGWGGWRWRVRGTDPYMFDSNGCVINEPD